MPKYLFGDNPERVLTTIGVSIGGFLFFFCCAMGLIRCFCPDVDCGDDGGTSSEFEGHSSSGGGGGGSGEGGDGG